MKLLKSVLQVPFLAGEEGQSAVEYLVICTALVTLLLVSTSQDGIYQMMSHTMQDKYKSYAFGVSIADPPSKAFDDEVKKDAEKVKEVLDTLGELEELITHAIIPDILHGKMPSKDSVKEFVNLLKSLF